ncbi:MAG: glycosyltransferase [Gemmataceae bacterium]|nr:glycosyltransferase [Gemmataceae bacterium]
MDAARVVLVHDWLTGMRGGEKCLEAPARRWPAARLLTLFHTPGSVSPAIERLAIRPSRLNRLPRVRRYYRYLLPAMPFAAGWNVADADLVVSFSHCVAKSARPPEGVPHVCYCFTPMRYAWHMQAAYFRKAGLVGRLKAAAVDKLLASIRDWDRRTADRVSHFVAISRTVQDRIKECYGRESVVICPPVDTDFYTPPAIPAGREDFYLVVSALAPYKRFDLAVEACSRLGKKLVVIGSGQDAANLRANAGPNVEFLGWQPDEVIRDHLRRAKALLFPGEEDFGIVPLEAQACGCPVIAFGRGGATETVRGLGGGPDPTGVFFPEQNVDALAEAVGLFEREADRFDPRAARRQALLFRQDRYEAELFGYLDRVVTGEPAEIRKAA